MRIAYLFAFAFLFLFSCKEDEVVNEVEKEKAGENKILDFKLSFQETNFEVVIDTVENSIKIFFPDDLDLTNLSPIIEISQNATVTPSSNIPQDFSKEFEYTVKAENGLIRTYKVLPQIGKAPKEISSIFFMINGKNYEGKIDSILNKIQFELAWNTNLKHVELNVNIANGATILPTSSFFPNSNLPEYISIRSTDGSVKKYGVVLNYLDANSEDFDVLGTQWKAFFPIEMEMVGVDNIGRVWGNYTKIEGPKARTTIISSLVYLDERGKAMPLNVSNDSIPNFGIKSIVDLNGVIYFANPTVLYAYKNDKLTPIVVPNVQIDANHIVELKAINNKVYMLTKNALYEVMENKIQLLEKDESRTFVDFAVYYDKIALITTDELVVSEKQNKLYRKRTSNAWYSQVEYDSKGNIWISDFSGMVKYDGFKFEEFSSNNINDFPGAGLYNFAIDKSDLIWMAWGKHGATVLNTNGELLKTFNVSNSKIVGDNSAKVVYKNNKVYLSGAVWRGEYDNGVAILELN